MNLYEGQSKVVLRPKTTEQVSQARRNPATGSQTLGCLHMLKA